MARRAVVMKFGGTSVGTAELIDRAAERVAEKARRGFRPVVVVSAMAGETDRLHRLALAQHPRARAEEIDVVASIGEQVTVGLFSIALRRLGLSPKPLVGSQVRIVTDDRFGDADILQVETARLEAALSLGQVPVVGGYQGVTRYGELTTLGRGGSDTTAIAIAATLGGLICEIYTDVDGVYSGDPHRDPASRKLERLSYGTMRELADHGAKVLHAKCVRLAEAASVPIHVRSSFAPSDGTWVGTAPETADTAKAANNEVKIQYEYAGQ